MLLYDVSQYARDTCDVMGNTLTVDPSIDL